MVKGILESNDINAIIKNESLSGLVVAVEVWATDDAKAAQAEVIINEFQSQPPEPGPSDEAA